ncbi:MAG: hypothetical protein JKX85_03195 [Phycisphaeraceae bacterium]|nr:hypothetical protein [Phycisphaeraceae bacterium]
MKITRKNWIFALLTLGFASTCPTWGAGTTSGQTLTVVDQGQARVYLDIDAKQAKDLNVQTAIADFTRCISIMTGQALPRGGGTQAAFFNPAQPQPTRFECRLVTLEDASASISSNARLSLIASTNSQFSKNPFAEAGEKVGWGCAWNRSKGTLTFGLQVANQAYYGPGYGPVTFETLQAKAPDFKQGGSVRLALEIKGGRDGNIRGGYAIDDQPWVYTQWYDPAKAGVDTKSPGKSDKKGKQDWTADWQKQWAGKTSFYVSGYHAKGRIATVGLKDITVTREDKTLFLGQAKQRRNGKRGTGPLAGVSDQG